MSAKDSDLRLSHVTAALAVGVAFLLRNLIARRSPRAIMPLNRLDRRYAP